jgi:hypothetical protein
MHKLEGNRTLAHSGGNALDQTVTHVAGYLPARLAQLVIRTSHSSQRMLPCLPLFAVHTGAWPVVRFGARAFGEFLVCRIAEDAAHCTVGSIRAIQSD